MSFATPALDLKSHQLLARWTGLAYLCVGIALILVLAITGWGAYLDFYEVRITHLQGEVGRLRSHAVRTVSRIEERVRAFEGDLVKAIGEDDWLRSYWQLWVPSDKSRLYGAVVDAQGKIILHTWPQLEGKAVAHNWYVKPVPEAGDDVFLTNNPALTTQPSYDIRIPIQYNDREIGVYHSGLDPDWFDEILDAKIADTWRRWVFIFGGVAVVVSVAMLSLYQIFKRTMVLREAVEFSRVRQFVELGELAAGIAHEIRNPINAIRLNLHALQRLHNLGAPLDGDEAGTVIGEARREIERVEGLMRIMLGYARPERAHNEELDLRAELEATVGFLEPVMERDGVTLRLVVPPAPMWVFMDRNRLRQIMLNLLNNAKEAVGAGGHVDVILAQRREGIEISVADNGPGVAPGDRERIFDPFYSTKDLGTGLGLALVKRFVEEASGKVYCEENGERGARFRLVFPEGAREVVNLQNVL